MILFTGGAGFIGSSFILDWFAQGDEPIGYHDKLTYAVNLESLARLLSDALHLFMRGDLGDRDLIDSILPNNDAVFPMFGHNA